jgi:colanic acid/amylovoran biosynthesis glycosyltransferase
VPEATIGYVLKMYPRFSETFVLNELLELERQGVRIHIFSLKKPDDGLFHADVARLRARVTYVPESPLLAPSAFAAAHREAFAGDPQRYLAALGALVRRPRRGTLKHFLRAGYIAPLLRRYGIRHVHAHFASTAASVALHLHRLTGTPYSLTAHAKDIYRDGVDREQLATKLRSARFAVTVSDYNKAYLSRLAPGSRVVRIYNGIDLERFAANGHRHAEPPLVLAVGRLVEKKGFAVLIRACALLRDRRRSFRCAIVGKGPLEGELCALVTGLGLGDHVELTGPLPQEKLLDLYPQAAVVVAPCVVGSDGNRDGLPTVLIEAMALGIPVVATDVTGIPELVEDGRTGTLAPPADPARLADALERVLDEPAAALTLARAGRERIEQSFDVRRNVARLRSLFEHAVIA